MNEAEIRADERKKIAAFVADFSWILPLFGDLEASTPMDKALNEASDDAACLVCEQIADAILNLAPQPAPDPRDPDHTRSGIFADHNCWKCNDGKKACANGNPSGCEFPRARND